MQVKARERGRFVALSGLRTIAGPTGSRYELFVIDRQGCPVSHLTEWYRLRKTPGPNGTRRTYLAFLRPFFGYLLQQGYAWNSEPEHMRRSIREFLREKVACHVIRDTKLDGYFVDLTGGSPLAQSSLRVLLAAIRDFYEVMGEAGLYPYSNPLHSALLQRLNRERLKYLAGGEIQGQTDTNGETGQINYRKPTAYFRQRRGQAWQPDPALTSQQIQERMTKDLDWMTQQATTQRDRLALLLLRETGARLDEILGMTAGGYRKARDPYQAYVVNKGSYGREDKLIRFPSTIEALLVRYVRTERAKYDPHGRKHLSDLDDTEPIFLTRRRTRYNPGAFYHHWRKLFVARPEQKEGDKVLPRLEFTPHDMRHLRVTGWLTKIRRVGDGEKKLILRRGVQRRMGWRSPLTIHYYDHSFTEREDEEVFADFQRKSEEEKPVSVQEHITGRQETEPKPASRLSVATRQANADLDFWKDEL